MIYNNKQVIDKIWQTMGFGSVMSWLCIWMIKCKDVVTEKVEIYIWTAKWEDEDSDTQDIIDWWLKIYWTQIEVFRNFFDV